MTEAICAHCGVGLLPGTDSALKNAVYKREGFRDLPVKVHKRPYICQAVNRQRAEFGMKQAAEQKRQNVWYRRLARQIRTLGVHP